MERVKTGGYGELIAEAYDVIPNRIGAMLRPDWFTGSDPVFAGLHSYPTAEDGRSLNSTAHVSYEFHQSAPRAQRHTTVVLPERPGRDLHWFTLVHELGHVLHEVLDFKPDPEPVSEYAKVNRWEAFAEAFAYWVVGRYIPSWNSAYDRIDPQTRALFERLRLGE